MKLWLSLANLACAAYDSDILRDGHENRCGCGWKEGKNVWPYSVTRIVPHARIGRISSRQNRVRHHQRRSRVSISDHLDLDTFFGDNRL